MRRRERQARIADMIWQQGEMSVDALAQAFEVSAETIRRDLAGLASDGVLQKVHGGARRSNSEGQIRVGTEASFCASCVVTSRQKFPQNFQ